MTTAAPKVNSSLGETGQDAATQLFELLHSKKSTNDTKVEPGVPKVYTDWLFTLEGE